MKKKYLILYILLFTLTARANKNLKVPTMGGKLFWTDVKVVNGWKIQENVFSGHCRLINGKKFRYAWGSKSHCVEELVKLTSLPAKKKTVVLIHGLGVRKQSLDPLVEPLEKQGFQVVMFGYSAFFEPLESCADKLESVLSEYNGEIYAVTHSMGGILLRQYQQKYRRKINGVVMIAPPNNGAKIVDSLEKCGVSPLLGVNGKRLTTDCEGLPKILPGIYSPVLVIAGARKNKYGYFPLLKFMKEDNDGVVSVDTTKLNSPHEHLTIEGYHVNLMKQEIVHQKTIEFLKSAN